MLRRVKKEVCGYLISWWFVKTFWMPIFGLHAWLKNRPRLPVLDASIIGIKVRRLASFSLVRFQIGSNSGDVDNRESIDSRTHRFRTKRERTLRESRSRRMFSETWLIKSFMVGPHYWTLVIVKHYSCWTESIHGWCFLFRTEHSKLEIALRIS